MNDATLTPEQQAALAAQSGFSPMNEEENPDPIFGKAPAAADKTAEKPISIHPGLSPGDPRRPMSEVVTQDDALSKLVGRDVYAANFWPAAQIFMESERSIWRYASGLGAMMIFSRYYPEARLLVDRFAKPDHNAIEEAKAKCAAVERFNRGKKSEDRYGYVAVVADYAYGADIVAEFEAAKKKKVVGLKVGASV